MSAASEALADVRGWLCDNLSEGDAGKVCGMLSVVSRHIAELEDENARLRSCLSDDAENAKQIMGENAKLRACLENGCADCAVGMGEYADSICDQIKAENAELRQERDLYRELFHLTTEPDRYVQVRNENEKLRKLARGLNWCTENAKVPSAECEHCPLGDTFFECGELSCEKLMRELGIEAD